MRALLAAAVMTAALLAFPATAEAATCGSTGVKTITTNRPWKGYSVIVTTVGTYRNCKADGRRYQRFYAHSAALGGAACAHGLKYVVVTRRASSAYGIRAWTFTLFCSRKTASAGGQKQLRYGGSGVIHTHVATAR